DAARGKARLDRQHLAAHEVAGGGDQVGSRREIAVERAARYAGLARQILHRDRVGSAGLEVDDEGVEDGVTAERGAAVLQGRCHGGVLPRWHKCVKSSHMCQIWPDVTA